jgi:hypothetical protein
VTLRTCQQFTDAVARIVVQAFSGGGSARVGWSLSECGGERPSYAWVGVVGQGDAEGAVEVVGCCPADGSKGSEGPSEPGKVGDFAFQVGVEDLEGACDAPVGIAICADKGQGSAADFPTAALEAAHLYSYAARASTTMVVASYCAATCIDCSISV